MLEYHSLTDVQNDLQESKLTCRNLVDHYLNRIGERQDINAFLEVFAESAREKAEEVDQKIKSGTAGKLAGMVIGLKDNLCYKGHKVSASSKILDGFESLYTGTAVQRLLDEDAIIIGRLNCDEFAMGSSNENSAFGSVGHPDDVSRVPGGSSGGSAAAVRAGLCMATLGSDTGGSIRQPASFCGIVGMKPTYGRISRYGLIAYASSFDQIGPLTNTVEDAALLVEVMAGEDGYDATASQKDVPKYSKELAFEGKAKIGYIQTMLESEGLNPAVKKQVVSVIDQLKSLGHTVEPVETKYLEYMVPTYYVLTTAEASSNLSRYDGIRYGYRSPQAHDLTSTYKMSRSEGFGEEVKRRIMLGTFVLSAGYYDAYYSKGQKVRRLIQQETLELLSNYDFLLSPTTPHGAFQKGAKNDPVTMYLEDIFTVQANIAGVPAISLPMGNDEAQMPTGIQLLSGMFKEADLFAFANYMSKEVLPTENNRSSPAS